MITDMFRTKLLSGMVVAAVTLALVPSHARAEAVKTALDDMDLLTFYGHVKFDTTEEAHGLQAAHDMVYVQWQKDADGNLVKEVVWPVEGQSAEPLYPLPH